MSPVQSDFACPVCRATLAPVDSGHGFQCHGCGSHWPIVNGVPRFVPHDLSEQQRETSAAFGWQWQHFTELHKEFEAQFLDWISPITPEFFARKRVLDAGCGIGRHAFFAASWGASKVVAVDLSGAVETAQSNLSHLPDVQVVQADMLRLPFWTAAEGGGFDLIYSIGVLHHLPSPSEGFRRLLPYLRPGGMIAIWVYGYEGNGLVRNVVEPLRRVSRRLPPHVLRPLALPLAGTFHLAAHAVYGPLADTRFGRRLPLSAYGSSVAEFSFRQNYGIVFDQLVAPTTFYLRRHEVEQWFVDGGLEDVAVSSRHGNSWRGLGRAPRP